MEPTKEQTEADAYEPFGDRWRAMVARLPKTALIEVLRKMSLDYRSEHERAERLEKALRVLLERVEPLVDLVRRTATDRELGSRAVEALVAIKGALAEPETCEWRPLEVGDYATKCGKLIGLVEWRKLAVYASELTLCPGCGREIKVTE